MLMLRLQTGINEPLRLVSVNSQTGWGVHSRNLLDIELVPVTNYYLKFDRSFVIK